MEKVLQRGRACEGAEISSSTTLTPRRSSFNGAAPVRARKFTHGLQTGARWRSFNGAAPVRARKYCTGINL